MLVTGPWPFLLTTNWDCCLETAWDQPVQPYTCSSSSFDGGLSLQQQLQKSRRLPVMYRKDSTRFFGHIKTQQMPIPVLKLHGDFTERGRGELVAGHAQYRRVIFREVGFLGLLRHFCARYSFLFYGCSLSDKDLLGVLDDTKESLGPEIGPHFWLTADEVPIERREFLLKHYRVHTIHLSAFSEQVEALTSIVHSAWTPPMCGCTYGP